jgi:ABC-type molybdenum transport system ATPase subunit/photorepair protein PhrA
MQRYHDLKNKFRDISGDIRRHQTIASDLQSKISHMEEEIQILGKVSDLFKHLIERYVNEYAESFSELVTEGLQAIFFDQDLKFHIDVEQKRGKISINFVLTQDGIAGDPLTSFGGGVASVISLLLRILMILKTNSPRYLILDESMAALSDVYVQGCAEFLKKLCADLDVRVLLVTHNPAFLEFADQAYHGDTNASGHLILAEA